ncbi:MAG: hypothetical protein PUA75_08480 [Clostridiales bacterium]|nr:hypothetical protein [Clostridiales bacterium]
MAGISGYDSSSLGMLFSSVGNTEKNSNSSDLLGISYTDYASLKNGSYRKLVSAYYTKVENGSSSSATMDSKQTLTSIKEAASDVKDSASALLTKGKDNLFQMKTDEKGNSYVEYDTDAVYKAVKNFISDYNNLVDAAAESDTASILRTAASMVKYTSANEKALSEVGITVGSDNKLSIDEDKFKNASKARVQSLFQSTGGYAYQVNAKATSINSYASMEAKKAGNDTNESYKSSLKSTSTSKDTTKTLGAIEEAAEDAKKTLTALRTTGSKSLFNQVTKTDEEGNSVTGYDIDAIYKAVKSFAKDYNTLVDKTEDSDTKNIHQARKTMINYTLANKAALAAVGITIDSDDNLSIDEEKFKEADMSKVKSLFQNTNSFGAEIEEQISKIDTYAELEASKSNTYSDDGTYTYNYNSGDLYSSLI